MGEPISMTDRLGNPVAVGDEVRVISVTLERDMEDDDRDMIEYMVGSVCPVEGIDASGLAWVTMWWNTGEGSMATRVGLGSHEMEKVA